MGRIGREKEDKIILAVATNMLTYRWTIEAGFGEDLVLPTKEQVIREYQMSPLFNRAVTATVDAILNILDSNNYQENGIMVVLRSIV